MRVGASLASGIRIPDARWSGAIGEAFNRLPGRLTELLGHVRFVCGVDPLFAGLHSIENTDDGRSYRGTAHCCYPFHLIGPADRRVTTIVMPTAPDPSTVVHELGHALHEVVGFSYQAAPVTKYAKTNRYEAFAEALVAWTHWYGERDAAESDIRTLALFEELAA